MAPVRDLILESVKTLKTPGSAKGVSRSAINANIGDKSTLARINMSLKKLVESGKLIQVRDSFKLSPEAKKAAPKKKVVKKTAVKKATKAKSPKKAASPKKKVEAPGMTCSLL